MTLSSDAKVSSLVESQDGVTKVNKVLADWGAF